MGVSLAYSTYQAFTYLSVKHPTRMEQYEAFLKDRDIFLGPDGSAMVLNPEQLEECNARGGCVVVKIGDLEEALSGAYAEGQRLKIGGHD
jgi:hypothetical protein